MKQKEIRRGTPEKISDIISEYNKKKIKYFFAGCNRWLRGTDCKELVDTRRRDIKNCFTKRIWMQNFVDRSEMSSMKQKSFNPACDSE